MAVGNPFAKSQGFDFVSNNKYLQNDFTGSTPLDFSNISSSGIMSQAPVATAPLQYVPEGGGDDDTGPKDYGYTGPGSTGSAGGFNIDDIGEGTIDDEDIENNPTGSLGIVDALRAMGAFTFGGPINTGFSINKSINRNKQKETDKIDADIAASDYKYGISDARLTAGGATQETMDSYSDGQGGYAGASTEDYGGGEKDGGFIDGTNRRPFNSGGRIGYFFGGRVNYKQGGRVNFKNGGLASIL